MGFVEVHVAALYVALVKSGLADEASSFLEWAQDNLDLTLDPDTMEDLIDA